MSAATSGREKQFVDPSLAVQYIVNGLMLGAMYSLIAVGLTLLFGVMNIVNFAHGELFMLGAYSVLLIASQHTPYLIAVLATILIMALVGLIVERVVFRLVYAAPHQNMLLISLALMLFLQGIAEILWTADSRHLNTDYLSTIQILGAPFSMQRIIIVVASVVLIGALYVFLQKTKLGKAMRATAQDGEAARLRGINPTHIFMATFAIATAMAAAAGALLAPLLSITPSMGSFPSLKGYSVVVLGGTGSLLGSLLGSLILGLSESFSYAYSPVLSNSIGFIILIVILVVRPQGLFGQKV